MRLLLVGALAALAGALPMVYHRKPSDALEKRLEQQETTLDRALAHIEALKAEVDGVRALDNEREMHHHRRAGPEDVIAHDGGRLVTRNFPQRDTELTEACYERQPRHSRVWFATSDGWGNPAIKVDITSHPDPRYNVKMSNSDIHNRRPSFCKCAKTGITYGQLFDSVMLYCQANGELSQENTCRDFAGWIFYQATGADPPPLKDSSAGCHGASSLELDGGSGEVVVPGVRTLRDARRFVADYNRREGVFNFQRHIKVQKDLHLEVSKKSPVDSVGPTAEECPVIVE